MIWWMLLACDRGPDLPDGWDEDARPVTTLQQDDCAGQPSDDLGVASFSVEDGPLVVVDWNDAPFRCDQPLAGFWRITDELQVLVQPADMSGNDVARCDCLYDVDVTIADVPAGAWPARLVTRGDHANLPNDLELVERDEVEVP